MKRLRGDEHLTTEILALTIKNQWLNIFSLYNGYIHLQVIQTTGCRYQAG